MLLKQEDKMKLDTNLTRFAKINSKWIIDLRVNCKTKFPEDNIEENLGDLGFGNDFLYKTPKSQYVKEKTSKLNSVKI